ncbi:MAG TPA: chemotaxis response regulator protein-glutamate methylesterase, partial [Firmicutes bacterium]|nr:chemotaxis response regulator protein-glutamate methylesterase [Bacillota bacterium]
MIETATKVRVLIVDDSAFMRCLLSDLLEGSGQITVVGIARNGIDAVAKNMRLVPDVVTLDIEMPEMDGLSALTELMNTRPVPVVMLS